MTYRDIFGIDWTNEEMQSMSTIWVCTEHKRFLPCRSCLAEPWRTVYPHSCDSQDVEIVRRWQRD
jgi:hypothetical protein